jgi:uncharacterized protein (TIGR02246 family)
MERYFGVLGSQGCDLTNPDRFGPSLHKEACLKKLIGAALLMVTFGVGVARSDTPADTRRAVESVVLSLPDAWNARDAQRFAAAFSEPHDYVAVGGLLLTNLTRQQTAQGHAALWKGRFAEGSKISFEIVSIEQITPEVVVAIAKNHNDFLQNAERKSHDSILTVTLIKTEDGWRIRQFNNNLIMAPPRSPAPAKP